MSEDVRRMREEKFSEADSLYQKLISDSQNTGMNRQPNAKIKEYYKKAHFYHDAGNMPMALCFINITLNKYKDRLGIPREQF